MAATHHDQADGSAPANHTAVVHATEQLPIPFDGFDLRATPAMQRGTQVLSQCGSCGVVVVNPSTLDGQPRTAALGPCPGCTSTTWWRQDVNPGGSLTALHLRDDTVAKVGRPRRSPSGRSFRFAGYDFCPTWADDEAAAVVDLIVDALDHHPAVDHGADVPAGEVVG